MSKKWASYKNESLLEKWVTLRKMAKSHLEKHVTFTKWVTLGKMADSLKKICHSLKNGSVRKMSHT